MILTVNDNHYNVKVVGQGPPLVLFHGFTGSTATWNDLIDQFSTDYQCIAIDLPGHGQSRTTHLDGMIQCCEEVVQVLEQLDISTFDLLGYSMGGRTALVFTAYFPDKVNRLILEGASPGLEGEAKIERQNRDEKLAQFIEEKGIQTFVEYWEDVPLFQTQKALSPEMKKKIRKERLSQDPDGLALSLRTMGTGAQPSLWGNLENLGLPVCLITGELDHKFTSLNQNMVQALPIARHEVVSNVGHAVHLENPEIFGKIVMNYLS
ncbi:2-succinyl-6-hydroxy-2,4-cyclohexadiene-1-carboxylate synthase [Tenuibacillus multivorans]|uniref:Putative 2-succinyl-6-hydroxy-2,4-cyclohexadiene-1-carboxylate synthase n=1 Tax=Tenuibacillus multivorans TaxID=237069 RepID=A0A1H0FQZ5_9BACI|nr:2-succinyl-6-hydroxy-2,4-cyclohexadiene-1-carboxylate synthase [Tenuibacillus multivorans]GEL77920.1 putative 2-succinyl-6-hydroxy-2,4-cyclohexadiene-1-carboxylate synthase [Tenuibacillus multivorans]SDN97065.1 2-succinyl-6-hydroxy-2,4-cyclohexadiene-1-carboxylate synthase [Tenuibacillus multivorans]